MPVSEVARFRQQQAMQEEAARQGLYGFAAVASHEAINARMEQATPQLIHLLKAGKVDQFEQVIETMQRELGELEKEGIGTCHTMSRGDKSHVAVSTETETV